jgi:hypothetical protein
MVNDEIGSVFVGYGYPDYPLKSRLRNLLIAIQLPACSFLFSLCRLDLPFVGARF